MPAPADPSFALRVRNSFARQRAMALIGATYNLSRASKLDAGYSFVKVKDADINNNQATIGRGAVIGTYSADIHLFGLQYQHTF